MHENVIVFLLSLEIYIFTKSIIRNASLYNAIMYFLVGIMGLPIFYYILRNMDKLHPNNTCGIM